MRLAVIADTHGDPGALQRVLAAIDRADTDEIWCLGDIVGLGATDPAATVDLIRDRCALALAGNHDRWVAGDLPLDMLPLPRQRAQLQWQHRELSDDQLAWLRGLADHARRDDVELWHASAEDPISHGITTLEDATDHLTRQRTPVGLVGHTHPVAARPHRRHSGPPGQEPRHREPRRRPACRAQPRPRPSRASLAPARPPPPRSDLAHRLTGAFRPNVASGMSPSPRRCLPRQARREFRHASRFA
jgi:predicted phosphodiesterase